jgi:hypothetical protein
MKQSFLLYRGYCVPLADHLDWRVVKASGRFEGTWLDRKDGLTLRHRF